MVYKISKEKKKGTKTIMQLEFEDTRNNMSYDDVKNHGFHVGDRVEIPGELIDMPMKPFVEATVQQICKYHVVFRLTEFGFSRSLQNMDCRHVEVVEPANVKQASEVDHLANASRQKRVPPNGSGSFSASPKKSKKGKSSI
ncbi:hypothetical protein LKD70_09245 [Ruminococcus sp. CLA-AA-H200]|uniref:DUF3850 domain-containing protein n=1 Tax=Ruminococcus turbiniformis TaxID=2881258 RepID=A0ABS8FX31_9FIRM|nr:hypothetical protein [Ruminococcus turbiniformis]MCC2254600.1 hypothetical protein [Ruminococcus turbiniformis]